jgi:hypothetical protein
MALPFKKPGGGFLNGVAGAIVGYKLNIKEWPGKNGGNPYSTLTVELLIKQDGADKPVQQFLPAGFVYDEQTISEDGLEIVSTDERYAPQDGTAFAKFLQSAIDAGLDEASFVEAKLLRFDGLVNQRFTFKRIIDEEGTKEFGKVTGKDGIERNRDFLLVGEYHGPVAASKATKATTTKATTTKGAKTTAAKPAGDDPNVARGKDVLLSLLGDESPLEKTSISGRIVKYSTENQFAEDANEHKAIREALRKLIPSEDFLGLQAGWKYDSKSGKVTL